ncbi:MAG: cation diffusion facilitator family transporter [Anaerolineae bacterium]|nr:cation diffusion facilitator family transporter [Anaerolineae bacterium]
MTPHSESNRHSNTVRLTASLLITLAFVFVEIVAGLWSNSLALLTDAAHNATDVLALALSWHAIKLAARPANARRTFGYHRAGIIVALFNSTTLIVIALGIFYEAYHRFIAPPEVNAPVLTLVAAIAFGVNLGTALLIRRGSEHDLNLRSAFIHLLGDAASTFAAILAGVGIAFTGWQWLDPLASVLIGGLILWNAWLITRETINILVEGTPRDVDVNAIVHDLKSINGVNDVHDLHVWSITQNMRALSAHIATDDIPLSTSAQIRREINTLLLHRYGIAHTTLQFECAHCGAGLYCDLEAAHHQSS